MQPPILYQLFLRLSHCGSNPWMHLDTQSVQGIIQSPAQRLTAVQKFQVGESRLPLRFEMIYSCMPAWSEVGLLALRLTLRVRRILRGEMK